MTTHGRDLREEHERFMRECFTVAERGHGRVSPNPLVGAVLVRKGRIVARGWHRHFGASHAEIDCINNAKGDLRRATLYVNLEPCSHYGKTPPCVDKLVAAGLGAVVVAMVDPNPLVSGRGIAKLRSAGIKVTTGVLEQEARNLNKFFLKHITTGIPYVHLKIAQTLDGYIGGPAAPRILTSTPSLQLVHRWRAQYDAVLLGAGTVAADDPSITVRHVRGRHPHVIVLDGRLSLKDSATLLRITHQRYVFLCVDESYAHRQKGKVQRLEDRGIIVLRFRGKKGVVQISDVLREVYKYGVGSILVEGGSSVFATFRDADLADEISVFIAPYMIGGGIPVYSTDGSRAAPRRRRAETQVRLIGRDVLFTTRYHNPD
ncbi:MAG: bifunctional diaminohydroxyphosphoribosylaminopyrimidine deaminase/5-amino-6-(5-phosphoribosylamino)uracil reductase RibD [Bacteroidota bacterium]